MNTLTPTLKEAMKAVLVDMAIAGRLDGDINSIDMDTIEEQATQKIEETKGLKNVHSAEALVGYTAEDSNCFEVYNKLKKAQEEGKGNDTADYYITMAEIYEHTFTVNELLETIKIEKY